MTNQTAPWALQRIEELAEENKALRAHVDELTAQNERLQKIVDEVDESVVDRWDGLVEKVMEGDTDE